MTLITSGESVPWLAGAAEEASQTVMSLLGRPFPRQGAFPSEGEEPQTFLSQLVAALLLALTSVHAAPQAWVGNAAQTLLPLLRHPMLQLPMKKAIEAGVKVRSAVAYRKSSASAQFASIMFLIGS